MLQVVWIACPCLRPRQNTHYSSVLLSRVTSDDRVKQDREEKRYSLCFSSAAMATQRIVDRLNAVSSWLQLGAESGSDDYAAAWHAECRALGALAAKELAVWKALCSGGARQPAVARARLCALLSVFAAGAHVRLDVGFLGCTRTNLFNAADKLALLGEAASWIEAFLNLQPSPASAPNAVQLGVAQALLRAQVLEGYSRQLSSSSDALAAREQATDCSAELSRFSDEHLGAATISLIPRLLHTVNLLTSLAALVERCPTIRLTQRTQALAAAPALGLGGRAAGSGGEGDNAAGRQGGSNPDEEWESSALEGAPRLVVELLDALGSSGVVEHASRAVLRLAEWLQDLDSCGEVLRRRLESDTERTQQTPEQERMQEVLDMVRKIRSALRTRAMGLNGAYHRLSTMAYYPGALFGDGYVARTAARVPSGATAVGYLDAAVVGGMAPLEARCHVLDAPRVALLRRVLTGPCARHLVLSMGLRTLSAVDGGSVYGLPQGSGLEALDELHHDDSGAADEQQRQQQHPSQQVRLLNPHPLRSMLLLLAVRPLDTAGVRSVAETGMDGEAGAAVGVAGTVGVAGEEAGAARIDGGAGEEAGSGVTGPPRAERPARRGLPCRAVRLEVTLRVARAAAGAAASAGDCRAPGGAAAPCYRLEPGAATAMSAVQALQFAWRHMPRPPRNGGDSSRRRAAMREWAAAVADVASSGVVAQAPKSSGLPWRLGQLLGLAPHVVGPMSRTDLPALASGGHLLRAMEALVRHVAEEGEGKEGREKEAEKAAAGVRGGQQGHQSAPATAGSAVCLPDTQRASVARMALQAMVTEVSVDADVVSSLFCDLLLLRGDDEALGTQGGGEGGAGLGAPGPRAAASVAVALGKLLWRCQGRMVEAMRGVTDYFASIRDAEGALAALDGAKTLLRRGACGTPFARLGRGGERVSGGGQRGQGCEEVQGEQGGAVGGEGESRAGGGKEGWDDGRDEQEGPGPSGSVRACVDTGDEEQQQQEQQQGREGRAGVGGEDPCGVAGPSGAACGGGGVTSGAKKQQQQQLNTYWQGLGEQEQLEARRRVWVWAYAAWRWLPGLAGLARRGAAEELEPTGRDMFVVAVCMPLLLWIKQLCLHRFLHAKEATGLTAEYGKGLGLLGGGQGSDEGSSSSSSSSGGRSAAGGDNGATAQGAAAGHGLGCLEAGAARGAAAGGFTNNSSCGGGGGGGSSGRWCGCWRGFLLRDVGVVELLATAFCEVLPKLLCDEGEEEEGEEERATLMWAVVDACVMLAAAYPEEVARAAWGAAAGAGGAGVAGGGGPGGDSGSGSSRRGTGDGRGGSDDGEGSGEGSVWRADCAWPPDVFEVLEAFAEMYNNQGAMQRALIGLGEWGGECVRQGRAVGPSEQQRAALAEAAEHIWCGLEQKVQLDVLLLPPLCELRALLPGVCSNPRCAVLPPPGQTEAEAAEKVQQAEAAGGDAGPGGRLEAWYCCRECREEHGREIGGEGGGRGAVQQ